MPKMGLIPKNKNFYKRKRPKLLPRSILAELAGFEPTG